MKKPRFKRITLADVARKAGVSVATASVAITGRPSGNCRVSAAVAEKVRQTARQLNYRPNLHARMLSTQRTQIVAILLQRAALPTATHYLAAAQRVLRQQGFTEIFLLHADDRLESERQHLEFCLQHRVEGIILIPLINDDGGSNAQLLNQIHQEEQVPVVQLGVALNGCVAPSVLADELAGFHRATRLLHAMGHERIVHVTVKGYDSGGSSPPLRSAHLRWSGYRRAVAELKLPETVLTTPQSVMEPDALYQAGRTLAQTVAQMPERPTALLTLADHPAMGLLAGLSGLGIRVPEQISLMGYGDEPVGRVSAPALSTLAPPYDRMGEQASEMLLKMTEGQEGEPIVLPPTVVMRESILSRPGA